MCPARFVGHVCGLADACVADLCLHATIAVDPSGTSVCQHSAHISDPDDDAEGRSFGG